LYQQWGLGFKLYKNGDMLAGQWVDEQQTNSGFYIFNSHFQKIPNVFSGEPEVKILNNFPTLNWTLT
jgi:hypothetical protein